jgi:hypothetical protein
MWTLTTARHLVRKAADGGPLWDGTGSTHKKSGARAHQTCQSSAITAESLTIDPLLTNLLGGAD